MTFTQIYSSSRGNLYVVTANTGERLLIECGVPWAKLQKALNYALSGIVGCLCSHEHADHSKAVKDVMKAGINVYASEGTFDALGVINDRRAQLVLKNKTYSIHPFDFITYRSNHDAVDPLLFTIRVDKEVLLFATDTSHINQLFKIPFDIIALGVSYEKEILQRRVDKQEINETVAKRLLNSHMEKKVAMNYLDKFCDLSRCRELHLLHMSGDNADKARVKREFEKRFFVETRMVADDPCISKKDKVDAN